MDFYNQYGVTRYITVLTLSSAVLLHQDSEYFLLLEIMTIFKRTLTPNGETDDGRTDTNGTLLDAGCSNTTSRAT